MEGLVVSIGSIIVTLIWLWYLPDYYIRSDVHV